MTARPRPVLPLGLILTLIALAFSSYVAIDDDLRTLVWNKWKGDVSYEWPGGDRNITFKVDIDLQEEIEVP